MPWLSSDQYSSALIFTGTFALIYIVWNQVLRKKGNSRKNLAPSIGSVPILYSIPFVPDIEIFHKYFLDRSYDTCDVMSLETFHSYMVILSSYDAIHEAMIKQSLGAADRPVYYLNEFFNPHAKGIVNKQYDTEFKRYHQLSLNILKEFGFGQSIMENRISTEVEDLIKEFKKLNSAPVNPKNLVASSVMSVISSIAVGDRLKDQENNEAFIKAVEDVFIYTREALMVDFIHSLYYLPKFRTLVGKVSSAHRTVLSLLEKRVEDYHLAIKQGHHVPESFISSFISREGQEYDSEQLLFILDDFMLAGFETSSATLVWILVTLANMPDVQARLHKELDAVVPRTRLPSLDDKPNLPYLEAVVLEVMRTRTLLPTGVPRKALHDITVQGYDIPKGTHIVVNIYAAHMSKKSWSDPDVFRPERFLSEDGTKVINKEKVISFGIGKRSCLGELLARQEIYLFVTGLLHNFIIRPPEGVEKIDVKEKIGVTLQPTPFELRFIPRS